MEVEEIRKLFLLCEVIMLFLGLDGWVDGDHDDYREYDYRQDDYHDAHDDYQDADLTCL